MTIYGGHDEGEEDGYSEREQNRSVHSQPADAPSQIPLPGDSNCDSKEDTLLWQQAESSNTHTSTPSRQLSPPAQNPAGPNPPFSHLQTPYLRQPNVQFGGAGFGLVPTPILPMAWLNNHRINYDQFTGPGRHHGRINRHEYNRRGWRNNGTWGNSEDFNSIAYRNQQRLVAAIFGGIETLPDPRPLRTRVPGFGPDYPELEWIDVLEGHPMRSPWGWVRLSLDRRIRVAHLANLELQDPNLTRVGHRAQLVSSAGNASPSRTEYGGGRVSRSDEEQRREWPNYQSRI